MTLVKDLTSTPWLVTAPDQMCSQYAVTVFQKIVAGFMVSACMHAAPLFIYWNTKVPEANVGKTNVWLGARKFIET